VLRNLLNNAVDHGEGLPVRVRVAADENAVAIVVRDFGVGLRDGEAEHVFNRFWRADPSRNRRTGGTGLGLAISVEDARLHGGWLEAWGALGQGACFRLTLPRRQGAELTDSPLPLPPDEVRPFREGEEDEVSPLIVTEVDAEAPVEEIAWQSADSVELDEATPGLPIAWHSASEEPTSPAPDHGEIGPDPELDDVHRPPPTGVPDRADSAVVGHDPEFDDVPSSAPESGGAPAEAASAVIGHDPEFDDVPGPASDSAVVGHDPEFDDVPGGGGGELASKSAGEAQ
jgi:two-component system sensor histidine kinase MtrB